MADIGALAVQISANAAPFMATAQQMEGMARRLATNIQTSLGAAGGATPGDAEEFQRAAAAIQRLAGGLKVGAEAAADNRGAAAMQRLAQEALAADGFIGQMAVGINQLFRSLTGIDLAKEFAPLAGVAKALGGVVVAGAKASWFLADLAPTGLASLQTLYRGTDAFVQKFRGKSLLQSVVERTRLVEPQAARAPGAASVPAPEAAGRAANPVMESMRRLWRSLSSTKPPSVPPPDSSAAQSAMAHLQQQVQPAAVFEVRPEIGRALRAIEQLRRSASAPATMEIRQALAQRARLQPLADQVQRVRLAAPPRVLPRPAPAASAMPRVMESATRLASAAESIPAPRVGGWIQAMTPAIQSAGMFRAALSGIGTVAAGAGGILVAAGAAVAGFGLAVVKASAALFEFGRAQMQTIDAHVRLGRMFGISTETVNQFAAAARMAGIGQDEFAGGLDSFARHMGSLRDEIRSGGGAMTQLLQRMRLDPVLLANADVYQQFRLIADSLHNLPSAADQARARMELFGRSGAAIFADMVAKGGAWTDRMGSMGAQFGAVLPAHQATQIYDALAEVRQAGGMISSIFQGFANQVATAMAPLVRLLGSTLKSALEAAAPWIRSLQEQFGQMVTTIVDYWKQFLDWLRQGEPIWAALQEVVSAVFTAFGELLGAALDVGRAIGQTAAALLGAVGSTQEWASGFRFLGQMIVTAAQAAGSALRMLADAGLGGVQMLVRAYTLLGRTIASVLLAMGSMAGQSWATGVGNALLGAMNTASRFADRLGEIREQLRRPVEAAGAGAAFRTLRDLQAQLQEARNTTLNTSSLIMQPQLARGMQQGSVEAVQTINALLAGNEVNSVEQQQLRAAEQTAQNTAKIDELVNLIKAYKVKAAAEAPPAVYKIGPS